MKNLDGLKERLKSDENFKKVFINAKTLDEAVDLAKQYGFDIDKTEVSQDEELTDNLLEAVAGGKGGKTDIQNTHNYYV